MIKTLAKRYSFFITFLIVMIIITVFNKDLGIKSFSIASSSFRQMLEIVPPIMLMLGLIDVWISRETMMKYMGDNSGIKGVSLAMLIGSIAAGPMYAAFPFTKVLLKKGVKFSNIIIFMNAWCVTKISTLMFEFSSLGYKFTLARLLIDIPGVIIMGYLVQFLMPKDELDRLYKENLD
ncbi:permease [Clostridium sp. AL.422]|uniref:permease n=1 Tax=Clostridium TaxID=1485 RepID=UPI00293DE8DB|nr:MULTISPECIES: permease [unclassified Clostridium]MDV4152657.1 permease [Clostridium sp. AL.422]